MKVLFAASEVAPIIKIGGLGDVAGSLPIALSNIGIDVDVIVPFFPYAKTQELKLLKYLEFTVPYDDKSCKVTLYKTKLPKSLVDVILVESRDYFSQASSNYFANNRSETELFAFFSKAVVEYIKNSYNTYDVIHCNDWHTGTVPTLLKQELGSEKPPVLLTIHNIMYQGAGDLELVKDLGMVPGTEPILDLDIEDNSINMLQQGVSAADFVNTVSVSYAKEIMTPQYGGGLEDILKAKEGRVCGILNGINYEDFPKNYYDKNWKHFKENHKKELLHKLGLKYDEDSPLMSFIGRLDPGQKGIDLIYGSLDRFVANNATLIIMGRGAKDWEERFKELSQLSEYKNNISAQIVFDIELAKEIYRASDFVLIPSKYEPCGLVQMIGMWYGAVPVAHSTGGLKDSIEDGRTGILFSDYSLIGFTAALTKAFELYKSNRLNYEKILVTCMNEDFSWKQSAIKYRDLYKKIVKLKQEE